MTKMVKIVVLAAGIAVALQPAGAEAANNQQSSKWWNYGLIRAGISAAVLGVAAYLFNRFTAIPLYSAVVLNYNSIAKILVCYGADVNQGLLEHRVLPVVVIDGNLDMVKFLIERGAKGDWWSDWTPLHLAIKKGYLDIVTYLVKKKAKIDQKALYIAVSNGHAAIVNYLLKKGADAKWFDEDGTSIIFDAAFAGKLDCVKILIDYGADINMAKFLRKIPASRPIAVERGFSKIIAYFDLVVDFDAVVVDKTKFAEFIKKYLATQPLIDANLVDIVRLTISRGSYAMFKELCKQFKQDVVKNASTIVEVDAMTQKDMGSNRWYLQLLYLAAKFSNARVCQGIIADQPELWDAVLSGKQPEEITKEIAVNDWKKSVKKLKSAWAKADKEKFRKPMAECLKRRNVLGGTVWIKDGKETVIPYNVGVTNVFKFVDPEDFGENKKK